MVSGIGWPEREIDDKNDSSYACIHPVRVLQQFSVPYKAVVLEDEKKEQEVLWNRPRHKTIAPEINQNAYYYRY